MDSEYREPSWRGVIGTLVAVLVVTAGLVFLVSYLLQQNCAPVAAQVQCGAPSVSEPAPGAE
jgi:hypothetical protein